jgi:lysophospholipase L1-like esterase
VFTKGEIHSFPTGEYYVAFGDSITAGSGDNIPSDDVSLDFGNSGGGFEPILNNLLTAAKGYPHTVVNGGRGGDTSADGVSRIGDILSGNPSAKYFLILYGTNDATNPAVLSGRGLIPGNPGYNGSYKDNMQKIITAVKNAVKIPYLAKVPYTADPLRSDAAIRDYNAAIVELKNENGITVTPPDFYTLFQNASLLDPDGIHPNGTGYQYMAGSISNSFSWFTALTQ